MAVYLICDGGYLRWPILICPYTGASKETEEGYFSSNLESVRKDVECLFGILKIRWKCLESGLRFRDIRVVEKVFVVCCMLHNIMLSEMERETSYRVGRGAPIGRDAIWLADPQPLQPQRSDPSKKRLAAAWGKRRRELTGHLRESKRRKKMTRTTAS